MRVIRSLELLLLLLLCGVCTQSLAQTSVTASSGAANLTGSESATLKPKASTLESNSSTPEPSTPEPSTPEPSTPEPSTPEPSTPEPEGGSAEPESEPEGSDPEPEGTDDDDDDEHSASFAEPEPDWEEAKQLYGRAWEVHIYFFGVAFGVVALYSLFSVIRLWKRKHLLSQKYFISLNLLVFLMGAVRSVYLLVDGYNTHEIFPPIVSYMLYTTFLPCVTSTFSLLFLSLLAATRMKFISPSIQKTKVILGVIIVHFALAITADVLTVFHLDARIVLFVCQMFYIVWGLFLFVGFMYIFGRLYKAAKDRQTQMNRYASRKLGVTSSNAGMRPKPEYHKLTLSLGTIVTLVSSILGLLTVVLLIYGMVDVYGVFVTDKVPEPWRWWGYHTAFRTLELAICVTVGYVATQPFRYTAPTKYSSLSSGGTNEEAHRCSSCFFYCAPCLSWCSREQRYSDVEWSQLQSEGESTLKRKASDNSELPLHDLVNTNEMTKESKTSAQLESPPTPEPVLGQTTPATLKSDNGVHMFSSEDRLNYEDNHNNADKPFGVNDSLDGSKKYMDGANGELSSLRSCTARLSEQSLDRVSQMTPELETSLEDETSGLLVDV